jgi:uncharacterized membrane protein
MQKFVIKLHVHLHIIKVKKFIEIYIVIIYKSEVRFEVSTAVTMMIIIFWEMTPCDSYKNRRFRGSYRTSIL